MDRPHPAFDIWSYWNIPLDIAGPEPNLRQGRMPAAVVELLGRIIRDLILI